MCFDCSKIDLTGVGNFGRVSKVGGKVILEPIEKPPFDAKAFWAKIDALGGDFPEVGDDDLRPDLDDDVSFD